MLQTESIVFFDGVCNFCNSTVNWLMKANPKGNLKFSSLQGVAAKNLLSAELLTDLSTIVYYRRGKCYVKSTAALLIFRDLAWYGFLALPCFLIPPFLRDTIYDWVARNRYHWFGKREVCRIPAPEERSRFID
jgi:predicted DCC family thiol-disulfide oxidoreductase YuxK